MSEIGWQLVVILFLIIANGFFSMCEVAAIAARRSRLHDRVKKNHRGAKAALDLTLAPSRFLAATQIGIPLVGILAGVFAGRGVAVWLAQQISPMPLIGSYHQEIGLAVVVVIVAYLSLVIGELVPKRLALRNPEAIASSVARPLSLLTKLAAPILYLLSRSTEAVCRLLGQSCGSEPPVTEEEIRMLVRQGTEAGVFEESEQEMVEAVLHLGDQTARALMTPRTQIAWLDIGDSADQTRQRIIAPGHSRYPVASGSLDKVEGVVLVKDILAQSLRGDALDLKSLMQPPLYIPRTANPFEVLEMLKKTGHHISLVVDEYGGVEGLLTHHDILEAIAGDIPFDGKPGNPKSVRRADGSWLLDGMLSVDEFKEIFSLEELPGENRDAYQTLGGFVFTQMGRIPAVSESFDWNGLRFEVVDMDGKRIDKVLVSEMAERCPARLFDPEKP